MFKTQCLTAENLLNINLNPSIEIIENNHCIEINIKNNNTNNMIILSFHLYISDNEINMNSDHTNSLLGIFELSFVYRAILENGNTYYIFRLMLDHTWYLTQNWNPYIDFYETKNTIKDFINSSDVIIGKCIDENLHRTQQFYQCLNWYNHSNGNVITMQGGICPTNTPTAATITPPAFQSSFQFCKILD